jgi:hypothetical protein
MDLSEVYIKNKHFVEKNIGDEKVLVPLSDNVADMNHVITLNEVGAFLYEQIDGEKTIGDIYQTLLNEYDVLPEMAKHDIEHFIKDSVNTGVLIHQC